MRPMADATGNVLAGQGVASYKSQHVLACVQQQQNGTPPRRLIEQA